MNGVMVQAISSQLQGPPPLVAKYQPSPPHLSGPGLYIIQFSQTLTEQKHSHRDISKALSSQTVLLFRL